MADEPTPIQDVVERLYAHDQYAVFGAIALVSLGLFYLADFFEIVWFAAFSGVAFLMFGGLAVAGFGWRRVKRWRYPSYYEQAGEE